MTTERQDIDLLYADVFSSGDSRPPGALGRFLGMAREATDLGPWPTQAAVAADLGVLPARVGRWAAKARRRWSRRPSILELGAEIRSILERRGVMAAAELADAVIALRGGPRGREDRRSMGLALLRAAVEAEAAFPDPRFRAHRRLGGVFVALVDGNGGPTPGACAAALYRWRSAVDDGEARFEAAVDEIVDSVLDAGDQEILAELVAAGAGGGEVSPGAKLLGALMADVMRRYRERKRRERRLTEGKE